MGDIERIIGRLEAFKEMAEREFHDIKSDIKALNQFKWRIAGGMAVLSVLLTAVIEWLHIKRG